MNVKVLTASELDYEKYVRLHRFSFTQVLDSNRSKEIQNLKHFKWKYNLPAGEAKIAVIESGDRYLSANSMIPLAIQFEGQRQIAWQSCDTATDPEARGKGYFSMCIKALAESLSPGEIFFGYPNGNSIKGFKKLGWDEKGVVPSFCGLRPVVLLPSNKIKLVDKFDSSCDSFLKKYSERRGPLVEKSSDYLNWRYSYYPKPIYSNFVCSSKDGVEGVLIVRKVPAKYASFSLIMEILALKPPVRHQLLKFASYWALRNRAWPVGMLQSDFSYLASLRSGYVPIPHEILPKRHVLMGMVIGHGPNRAFDKDWHVQAGDWDGF